MKAAVWHGRKDVRLEEVPEPPTPAAGQVRLEVSWAGICGTDLHEYLAGPMYIPVDQPHPLTGAQAPVILGHEMSGRVVEVGSSVTRVRAGDRVAVCPIIGCQTCRWCRSGLMGLCDQVAFLGISWHSGAFTRYVTVFDYMCYRLPPEVSDETGALLEPFAATVRAVRQGQLKPGERVAIVGTGPIGLMALQAAKIQGAKQVIAVEMAERRKELATRVGASAVIDPAHEDLQQRMRELTGGAGADLVVECAGAGPTGMLAAQLVRTKGRVVVMGVFEKPAMLDYTDLVYGEKTIMGSMGGYGEYENAIQMMAKGLFQTDVIISGKIGLEEILEGGFKELIEHKEENVKILVSPA